MANIARVYTAALTPRVIQNGFSTRGLWPLNLELIIGSLIKKYDLQEGQELQIFDGVEELDISSLSINALFSLLTITYKL